MTQICIDKYTLEVDGHAGYAKQGDDIVCAAISMLAQAYQAGLMLLGIDHDVDRRSGHIKVIARPSKGAVHRADGMVAMLIAGFALLAKKYPQNVCFAGEKTENS